MRHLLALLFSVLVAGACVGATPAPNRAGTPLTKYQRDKLQRMRNSAPADEYFGKMKLSYLGINNTFRDQSIRAGDHTTDASVVSKVGFAADALRDWQRKYPKDPQLARSLWLGSLVSLKIWTTTEQSRAAAYLIALRNHFATTYFGKQASAALRRGFTMHVVAMPQPCPSAGATTAAAMDGGTTSPAPGSLPTANPKYHIKVAVIAAPCYQMTPTPRPSPTASSSPSPAPRASSSPSPSPTARPKR